MINLLVVDIVFAEGNCSRRKINKQKNNTNKTNWTKGL